MRSLIIKNFIDDQNLWIIHSYKYLLNETKIKIVKILV